MFDDIKAFVEAHPYWIGGGVVAILVLYLVSSNSSAAATASTSTVATSDTGTDDAVTVAQLQASSASASTQAQAQLANNQLSAQLQSQQLTDATQITLAQIAAGTTPVSGTTQTPIATPPRNLSGHPRKGNGNSTSSTTSPAPAATTLNLTVIPAGSQYPSSGEGITWVPGLTPSSPSGSPTVSAPISVAPVGAGIVGLASSLFGAGTSNATAPVYSGNTPNVTFLTQNNNSI